MTKMIGEYQVTTGTAIDSHGGMVRTPVTFVRWLPDEFHNGDMLYFGDEDLLSMDEDELTETLRIEWYLTTSWYGDLETFEADA